MQTFMTVKFHAIKFFIIAITISLTSPAWADAPFSVKENLFDYSQPVTLGLTKPKKITYASVFKAVEGKAQYNHGAVLFPFKGKLFIQWQSSVQDEDAEETQVLFSSSKNGKKWQPAKTLVAARQDAIITNGGWWSDGKVLIAYINVWPKNINPKGGYVEYISSADGIKWSSPQRVLQKDGNPVNGIIEQDLKSLTSGRIVTAVHTQPGLIAKPYYTDDPQGIRGWIQGEMKNLAHEPGVSRELEPSLFINKHKQLTMVFRDQGSSFKLLASVSKDQAQSWSEPQLTNMPDSRAKQSAGNFPDGRAFLINNPSGSKQRTPLTLTLSKDGYLFDQAYLLKDESQLPAMLFAGKYKRVGYSYPKSIIWKNALWISYAVNKEDIEVARLPLNQF